MLKHRASNIDGIVKGELLDDADRGIVGPDQSFGKLRPGGHFNPVCQSPDDLAENPNLVLGIVTCYQQIGGMPKRSQPALGRSPRDGLL